MKQAITLQIIGVLFTSAGLALRVSGIRILSLANNQLNAGGGLTALLRDTEASLQQKVMMGSNIEATGIGFTALGAGLFLIGIILLLVRRTSK